MGRHGISTDDVDRVTQSLRMVDKVRAELVEVMTDFLARVQPKDFLQPGMGERVTELAKAGDELKAQEAQLRDLPDQWVKAVALRGFV